jgi:DNA-directed RNA polymerase I subunit RPA2
MEDAMIIKKSARERGFGHGMVYKTKFIDLGDMKGPGEPVRHYFSNTLDAKAGTLFEHRLDADGLPHVGVALEKGDPFYCVIDEATGKHKVFPYKEVRDPLRHLYPICFVTGLMDVLCASDVNSQTCTDKQ